MPDFDKLRIMSGQTEVAELRPSVDKYQNLRGGFVHLKDPKSNSRVGASLEGGDSGGKLSLGNDDVQAKVVINAMPNKVGIRLGHVKDSIILDAESASAFIGGDGAAAQMGLFPSNSPMTGLDTDFKHATIHLRSYDATLRVAGAGVDGRILLLGGNNSHRVSLEGSSGSIDAVGNITGGSISSHGLISGSSLSVSGSVTAGRVNAASITTTGNITCQGVTQRSRDVEPGQIFDLFSAMQDGGFIVELAASYTREYPYGDFTRAHSYTRWTVFTYKGLPQANDFPDRSWSAVAVEGVDVVDDWSGGIQNTSQGGFWDNDNRTQWSFVGGNVRLKTGDVAPNAYVVANFHGTLCVRALYGSLLDF